MLFKGSGFAELIGSTVIDFAHDFTMSFWLMAEQTESAPTATWILYKFTGEDNYLYLDLNTTCKGWTYLCLIQSYNKLSAYVNGDLVSEEVFPGNWGNPTGFAIVNDNPVDSGYVSFDELNIFEGINTNQIKMPFFDMEVNYSINGKNFKNWEVYVQDSKGITDALPMKEPLKLDWDDYHGEVVDLVRPRFDVREITLECFMKANGPDEFVDRCNTFLGEFIKPSTQRFMIDLLTTGPLCYEVYFKEGTSITKRWNSELMIGAFQLKLREPDPIKRLLKFIKTNTTSTVSITLTSNRMLTVFWGDGTKSVNVNGTGITINHTYATNGTYFIIIAGVIEDVTGFSTTGTIVWNKY